jgi:hypothetical protein
MVIVAMMILVADETYDPARVPQLLEMLRLLARRIAQLDTEGRLLEDIPALLKELGDVRSELFAYEVRTTFDTPETAEHRRIVDEAASGWTPDDDATEEGEDGWPESR